VTYAAGIKGNTATTQLNQQLLNRATVNVPLLINEGDKIKIDTASGSMERVKGVNC
jgi:elongation factor P